MSGPHPSHKTRVSMDASSFDEICEYCGRTDTVFGWGLLVYPCPNAPQEQEADPCLKIGDGSSATEEDTKSRIKGE